MIAVSGEEGQLGAGRGLHPPDDEPYRRGAGLTLEGGVEAAVGPHRELSPGSTVANPPHRLTQEMGAAAGGVGPALAQPGHQHVAGDGQQRVIAPLAGVAPVSSTGQAVVAGALLVQTVGLADR